MNANECLLTRMQEMSLDYHFTVEQEVGSATHAFFGFNGKLGFFFFLILPFALSNAEFKMGLNFSTHLDDICKNWL